MAEPMPEIAFDCAFATEKGIRRRKVVNEDSVCAHVRGGTLPAHTDAAAVLAVADGMGGGIAGDEASQLVIARLAQQFAARPYNTLAGELGLDGSDPRLVARYVVDAIHRELYDLAVRSGRHMGSTLDALVVHGNRFLLAHVGDSRTYLIRGGTIVLRTEPHSAKEALGGGSEHASVVLNMLGTSHSVTVESFTGDVQLGDSFVLCSDGICGDGLVADAEVLAILRKVRKLSHACRGLIMLAQQRGSTDDLSVVVARAVPPAEQREVANTRVLLRGPQPAAPPPEDQTTILNHHPLEGHAPAQPPPQPPHPDARFLEPLPAAPVQVPVSAPVPLPLPPTPDHLAHTEHTRREGRDRLKIVLAMAGVILLTLAAIATFLLFPPRPPRPPADDGVVALQEFIAFATSLKWDANDGKKLADLEAFGQRLADAKKKIKDDQLRKRLHAVAQGQLALAKDSLIDSAVQDLIATEPRRKAADETESALRGVHGAVGLPVPGDCEAIRAVLSASTSPPTDEMAADSLWEQAGELVRKHAAKHDQPLKDLCDLERAVARFRFLQPQVGNCPENERAALRAKLTQTAGRLPTKSESPGIKSRADELAKQIDKAIRAIPTAPEPDAVFAQTYGQGAWELGKGAPNDWAKDVESLRAFAKAYGDVRNRLPEEDKARRQAHRSFAEDRLTQEAGRLADSVTSALQAGNCLPGNLEKELDAALRGCYKAVVEREDPPADWEAIHAIHVAAMGDPKEADKRWADAEAAAKNATEARRPIVMAIHDLSKAKADKQLLEKEFDPKKASAAIEQRAWNLASRVNSNEAYPGPVRDWAGRLRGDIVVLAETVTVAAFQAYVKGWQAKDKSGERITPLKTFAAELAKASGKVKDDARRAEIGNSASGALAVPLKDLMAVLVKGLAGDTPMPANVGELGEALNQLKGATPTNVDADWKAILGFRIACQAQPKNLTDVQATWKKARGAAGKAGEEGHKKTLLALCDLEEFASGFELLKKQADWRTSQAHQACRDESKRQAQAILNEPAKYPNARRKAIEPLLREAAALEPPPPQALLAFRKFMETWKPGQTLDERLRNMASAATEFATAQKALKDDAKHLGALTNEARGKLEADAKALRQDILVELGRTGGVLTQDQLKHLKTCTGPLPQEVVGAVLADWQAILAFDTSRPQAAKDLDDLGKKWAGTLEAVKQKRPTEHCQKVLLGVCDLAEFEMGEPLLPQGWDTDPSENMRKLRERTRKWGSEIAGRLSNPPTEVAERVNKVKPRVTAVVELVEPVLPLPPDPLRDLIAEWKGTPKEQHSADWLHRLARLLKKPINDLPDGARQDVDAIISTVLSAALWARDPSGIQGVHKSLTAAAFASWIGKDALDAIGAVSDARTSKPSLELKPWDFPANPTLIAGLGSAGYNGHSDTRDWFGVEELQRGRKNPLWLEVARLNPQDWDEKKKEFKSWFDVNKQFKYTHGKPEKVLIPTPGSWVQTDALRKAVAKERLVPSLPPLDSELRAACQLEVWRIELLTLCRDGNWPRSLGQVHHDRRAELHADLVSKVGSAADDAHKRDDKSPETEALKSFAIEVAKTVPKKEEPGGKLDGRSPAPKEKGAPPLQWPGGKYVSLFDMHLPRGETWSGWVAKVKAQLGPVNEKYFVGYEIRKAGGGQNAMFFFENDAQGYVRSALLALGVADRVKVATEADVTKAKTMGLRRD